MWEPLLLWAAIICLSILPWYLLSVLWPLQPLRRGKTGRGTPVERESSHVSRLSGHHQRVERRIDRTR